MSAPPRAHRLALTTGLTYHALEWGDAAAPPVVLVHGFLDLAWGWDEVARRLAARFRVLAPDLRGHGDTDWVGPGGYYHFMDYVADLDEVVGRLVGDAPIGLVGHSMGGSVAAYLAGARPARVRRLALLEGQGPPDQDAPSALPARTAGWIDAWRQARTRAPAVLPSQDAAAARLRKHDDRLTATRAAALAGHATRPVDGGWTCKHDPLHATVGPYPFRVTAAEAFWRAIAAPVLVVDGAASQLRLPDDELARRRACLRACRHEVLSDAGHMLQRHQPEALAALLADFLA